MTASENKSPPAELTAADLPELPPLHLAWLQAVPVLPDEARADGLLDVTYGQQTRTFVLEYKKRWNARIFRAAVQQALRHAESSPLHLPMVVLPYLSSEHLDGLLGARVSGLDLCGNALILAPARGTDPGWLLRYTGQANRFRQNGTLSAPYQGKASLVARMLLVEPVFANAGALQAEIGRRGRRCRSRSYRER